MEFSVDLNTSFFDNMRKYHTLEDDEFSVFINDKEIKLPFFEAISKSSKITEVLFQDDTVRSIQINQIFRDNDAHDKLVNFLASNKLIFDEKIEKEEELFDFAEFGAKFGNRSLCGPLFSYKQEQDDGSIDEKNVLNRIEAKDILSSFGNNKESIDEEIKFISNNFSLFSKKENFIEWCKDIRNEDRVEQIISNEEFYVDTEDDLFSFIVNISNEGNSFIYLLSYLHLEYCSVEICKQLIEMTKKLDIIQLKSYRDSILECISKRLLNECFLKEAKKEKKTYFPQVTKRPYDIEGDICRAAKEGKLTSVRYLVEHHHANVETRDNRGSTPINNASANGHLEVVKYLHEICHASVETKDSNGCTSINNASYNGHLSVVKYLYENCHASVETKDNFGCTPISWASQKGYLEVVKYLFETCHAKVEIKGDIGYTPIHYASFKGHIEVVKYLYETCRANVETEDNCGSTPINTAAFNGHLEVVKYLKEKCYANVTKRVINSARPNCYEYLKPKRVHI